MVFIEKTKGYSGFPFFKPFISFDLNYNYNEVKSVNLTLNRKLWPLQNQV
jgi:hypothetical protein